VNAPERAYYRLCSTCKDPIPFEGDYFRCSVSTCNRKRMTLSFCSLSCWDAHQAEARHRDAGAEAERAPTRAIWEREAREQAEANAERDEKGPTQLKHVPQAMTRDILIVVEKLKMYVRERSGMSTSEKANLALSDHVRALADKAIEAAGKDGRKTVMDRDVLPLVSRGVESRATDTADADDRPDEVLVVVAKLKQYIKGRAGMNTSDSVAKVFSAYIRRLARQGIRRAATEDRKMVMDRDFLPGG
jgi:histone H3/H4